MSSDPNQPAREWWQQQEPDDEPEEQGPQGGQDSQATRQYPVNRNYQEPQATQRGPGTPAGPSYQDSQATRQYPVERGRPADQGHAGGQGTTADPRYPGGQGAAPGPRHAGGQEAAPDPRYPGGQEAAPDPRHAAGQGAAPGPRHAAGQGFSSGSGNPATPTFTPSQGNPGQGNPGQGSPGQGYPSGQGFPSGAEYQASGAGYQAAGAGYQQDQDYPAAQGHQAPRGTQDYTAGQDYPPGQNFPAAQGYQSPATPRARRRRRRWPWITLIVIIVLLIAADRGANAFAEDQMASQFQSSLELSGKPHVTIQGFPFLTQLAAQDLHQVDINASNETAGPGGQLAIQSLTATLHGLHIHGTNSATIDDFTASALVTFTALAKAGNIPGGITLSADGPNRIKAHVDLAIISGDVVLQVTQVGDSKINIKVVDANGLPTDALGSLVNFTVSIPKLPAGVKIQKISVTSQGLRLEASGHNTTLSQ
jgi:hypothetical protein